MATYAELYNLHNDSALKNRVQEACIIAAEAIMYEVDTTPNHANRLIWSAAVFGNPVAEADRMFMAVLAANKDASVPAIQGASDEQIQVNVDDHVNLFATGPVV